MFDLDDFRATGLARLPGAFGPEDADQMRAVTWRYLEERSSIRETQPSTWPAGSGIPPGLSLRALKARGVFAPFTRSKALGAALDAIFGPAGWQIPKRTARILLTFPRPGPWAMPNGWHFDASFDTGTFPVPWVQLWAFMGGVAACGGGTLVLEGSHRLVERYSRELPPAHRPGNGVNWARFMKQDPFLARLAAGGSADEPGREILGRSVDIAGIKVRPRELTGQPGDMFITHGQVFHCIAPNTTGQVRLMLTGAIKPDGTHQVDPDHPSRHRTD
jgi:hypothetical protein